MAEPTLRSRALANVNVDDETISVAEVAARLGISRSSAYESVKRGDFPFPVIVIGRSKRVVRSAVDDALRAGEAK